MVEHTLRLVFKIELRKGVKHAYADALSRIPMPNCPDC